MTPSGSPRGMLQQVACFFVLQGKEARNHVRMAVALKPTLRPAILNRADLATVW